MPLRSSSLAASAAILSLCACSGASPGGLLAAARLDPLDTPPGGIAAAVGVPSALRLADGDATLRLALLGEGRGAPALVDETVPLAIRAGGTDAPAPTAPGETVYVGTIETATAARIAEAQGSIRALRAAGRGGEGVIAIEITGGCTLGAVPATLATSSWLRTDPDDGFVRTSRRVDLSETLGADGAALLLSRIAPCEGADR